MISSGEDHCVVLDNENNLWLWGSNESGQLGLGHCNEVDDLILFDDLSKEDKIQQIRTKGKTNYAILSNGKVFSWPFISNDGQIFAQPIEFDFPTRVQIKTMCCSYGFALFLTTNGLVYSYGKDNKEG
jgi:alpha-tubulin suppressor-like RCC1 family protein